jgi:short-subunit dehydrogenase
LVNNAGIGQRGLAEDTLPEVERAIMEVNYFGAVGLTRAALPLLLARPGGCVVAVSSVMGYVGLPRRSTYAASKFAMRGWFDSLRAEVANRGLHVCVVCPGYVRTELSQHALSADGSAHGVTDRGPSRGVDAARVARAIRRGIERRRDEVLVGGPETWVVPLRRHFPRLWSGLLRLALARGWF